MSPCVMYTDEQAYHQVMVALQRRGMSRRKASRTLVRLARRSLVTGARTLEGDDIDYHLAFHALRITAPEISEMADDTHPHRGMSARLCGLFSIALFTCGLGFSQEIMDMDMQTNQLQVALFAGTILGGSFFGIKAWIKWLRS